MSQSASLIAVDWLTSGRMARGERWAFESFTSTTEISVEGRLRLHEAVRLSPGDDASPAMTCGPNSECLGTVFVVGPTFATAGERLLESLGRQPIDPRRPVQFAASPLADGGAGVRFSATSTAAAWLWLRETFAEALARIDLMALTRRS